MCFKALEILTDRNTLKPYCVTVSKNDRDAHLETHAKTKYTQLSDKGHCVAQFFMYKAKDINK